MRIKGSKIVYVTLFTFMLIFLIAQVNASVQLNAYPRDVPINLEFSCRDASGGVCSSNYNCFLTMQYPNTSIAYQNYNLSRDPSSSGYYNVTLPSNVPIGDYNNVEVYCTNGVLNGTQNYQFTVRGAGSVPTVTEGIIYFIVVFVSIVLLCLCLYGIVAIKGGNARSPDGNVINVNNLKYLKIFLGGMAYVLLVTLVYFGMNISYGFSSFNLPTTIFQTIFEILMAMLKPFMVLLFVFFVIKFVKDIKIKNILSQGGEYYE